MTGIVHAVVVHVEGPGAPGRPLVGFRAGRREYVQVAEHLDGGGGPELTILLDAERLDELVSGLASLARHRR